MLCVLVAGLAPAVTVADAPDSKPRLILQITVDALRADLPGRYGHLLGKGGFRYLMGDGVNFANAHYQHANTETIVGHVSLATGAVPAEHGMIGNAVFATEPFQYNTDFLFGGIMASGGSTDISNSFFCVSFLCHHRFLFRLTLR